MNVRPERPEDHDAIGRVHEEAFGKADEARLVDAIRASGRFAPELSLVAEDGSEIVGHVLLSYVDLIGKRQHRVLSLAPMAVVPRRQREGIGSALVEAALASADALGEPLVVVLGHPWYYPRFGFRPAAELRIQPPTPVPDEAFMAIRLSAYGAELRGKIVYPPAYDTVA